MDKFAHKMVTSKEAWNEISKLKRTEQMMDGKAWLAPTISIHFPFLTLEVFYLSYTTGDFSTIVCSFGCSLFYLFSSNF